MGNLIKCKSCFEFKTESSFYFKEKGVRLDSVCKRCRIDGKKLYKSNTHKKCKHCGEDKLFSEFQKAGKGKWLQPYCKDCDSFRKKKWVKDNYNNVRDRQKRYYEENKSIISEKGKLKRKIDPIRYKQKAKESRDRNIEKRGKGTGSIQKKIEIRYTHPLRKKWPIILF